MIGFLRTRVRKQPIIALYFESETVLKFYYLKAKFINEKHVCFTVSELVQMIYLFLQLNAHSEENPHWNCLSKILPKSTTANTLKSIFLVDKS